MPTSKIDLDAVLQTLGPAIANASARLEETDSFVAEAYSALRDWRVFSGLVPTEVGGGGATHETRAA